MVVFCWCEIILVVTLNFELNEEEFAFLIIYNYLIILTTLLCKIVFEFSEKQFRNLYESRKLFIIEWQHSFFINFTDDSFLRIKLYWNNWNHYISKYFIDETYIIYYISSVITFWELIIIITNEYCNNLIIAFNR